MGNRDIHLDGKVRKIVRDPCLEPCPIERGMRIVGGKWTGSILWHLQDTPVRFNDLARQLGGASKKVITQRLRDMERNQLVKRKVLRPKPIAVTYEITEFGRTALKFLEELKQWTIKHDLQILPLIRSKDRRHIAKVIYFDHRHEERERRPTAVETNDA